MKKLLMVSSLDTLKQGDQLISSSQLVSANGRFALGFYTPPDTNNSYLALSSTDPNQNQPVWIGNREQPVPGNGSRFLTIGTRGELIITHEGGEPIELYAGGSGQNITATLLDSGNFVVKSSESSLLLWQSFDNPTDTLLPGMKLGLNRRTGRNWTLSSWFALDKPDFGAFTLEWDPSSSNFLVRRRGEVYWRSGQLEYYSDEEGKSRVDLENFSFRRNPFNFNFNFTRITSDEEESLMFSVLPMPPPFPPPDPQVATGWRMEYRGDISDLDKGVTVAVPSECYNYYNQKSAVIKGCEPRDQPKCRNDHQKFVFKSGDFMPNKGQVELIHDNNSRLSLSDCREACWNNCTCAAYTSGTPGCLYWRGQNLQFEQSVAGISIRKYFIESPPSTKGLKKHVRVILIVVGSVVLLILVITLFVVRKLRKGKREEELHELLTLEGYTDNYEFQNGGSNNQDLKHFTYASIQSATRNFSLKNKLGEGGFGPVYKGRTREGQYIAVKLLSRQSGQGLLEFKTELILISKLQHVNLVKVIGFCVHGDDKMIIYEYMHNKSLDFFLFNSSKREQLDWQKRFNIIDGTAQGLLYLHKYSRLRIIHRDLKPNNILLDENMNPKISDFGLARIFKQNASGEANTNRRVGTYGYMAPEYAMQGIFSVKSDVYCFGVLMLEIVSGRKNNSFHEIEGPLNLVEYAWEIWRKDSALELMDPMLRDSCVVDQLQRCIHIGLLCVENHAVDRPTIEDVISMLKNETMTLPVPKRPAFITRNSVVEEVEKSTPEKSSSANEVTLSEIQGR